MRSGSREIKTTVRFFARVNNTFSRRCPFALLMGPNLWNWFPRESGPYGVEMNITSRSSPWTFLRFLMKNFSCLALHTLLVRNHHEIFS
jgi:hypothetical protein